MFSKGIFSFLVFILVFLTLGLNSEVWAQEGASRDQPKLSDLIGEPVRVETVGGGNFQGTLLKVNEDRIEILAVDNQILFINREGIKRYQRITSDAGERGFYQDSASNRLIVIPTAFAMEPGEFHVTNQEGIVVTSSYGLSENVILWGGFSIPAALLSARFSYPFEDSFAFSVGSFAGINWFGPSSSGLTGLLIPYTFFSWGEPDNNLTVGGGVPFAFSSSSIDNPIGAVVVIGGKVVITSTTALVSENWVIWGKRYDFRTRTQDWDATPLAVYPAIVFRIADNRFSWDIGGVLPLTISTEGEIRGLEGSDYIPVPIISLTYRI